MIVTLTNDFHSTSVRLRVPGLPHMLSTRQIARVQRELCGMADCMCSGTLGTRGRQEVGLAWGQPAPGAPLAVQVSRLARA